MRTALLIFPRLFVLIWAVKKLLFLKSNMNRVLVIAGPSAVGKTTVMKKILTLYPEFEFVRSATTREARNDSHKSEYIYLSVDEFKKRLSDGKMLEYTEFGGNFYGTPESEIERIFAQGKIPLLILDINGVKSLKNGNFDFEVYSVYITADIKVLDKRLYERALTDGLSEKSLSVFSERKSRNRRDLEKISEFSCLFDAIVENTEIEITTEKIVSLFRE